MSDKRRKGSSTQQLELPLFAAVPASKLDLRPSSPGVPRNGLRVIQGGGQRVHEPLQSRDAVVRVLVESGADLLLRRISVERAEEIQANVDRVLRLFDQVDATPALMPVLRRQLDDLEALMSETRAGRGRRPGL